MTRKTFLQTALGFVALSLLPAAWRVRHLKPGRYSGRLMVWPGQTVNLRSGTLTCAGVTVLRGGTLNIGSPEPGNVELMSTRGFHVYGEVNLTGYDQNPCVVTMRSQVEGVKIYAGARFNCVDGSKRGFYTAGHLLGLGPDGFVGLNQAPSPAYPVRGDFRGSRAARSRPTRTPGIAVEGCRFTGNRIAEG